MTSIEQIIDRQVRRWELQKSFEESHSSSSGARQMPKPLITISRQHGTGGSAVAEKLAQRFNYTLLHRDIVDRICAETGYKKRIVESLDEHSKSQLQIWVDSILTGMQIDQSDYIRQLLQLIYSVSRLGGVVVVGRASNFLIGKSRGFHARIVASREHRVEALADSAKLLREDADALVDRLDRERADFVRQLTRHDIDDPLGYDLMINNEFVSTDSAVNLLATAAMDKFELLARDSYLQ